jgi:crotonobetainyl-CoA:carnitine CoA-transferase CaiB-like acyl-CoA transferase
MTRTTLALTLTAAAALAGCNQGQTNEAANAVVNEAPIELPPSIVASKIYRCKDNSVVYIDWLSDNKSANVRNDKNGTPTHVVGPEAGQAMVAEGYSLTGSATAATITYNGKSCKA